MRQITIRRCDLLHDKEALALAAEAWAEAERPERFKALGELIQAGGAGDFVLLGMWEGEELRSATAAQVLTGKCALAWAPQIRARNEANGLMLRVELLKNLRSQLIARKLDLVQAPLLPEQRQESQMFAEAGFQLAARLLYLSATAKQFPESEPDLPFSLEDYLPSERERLARLIDQTYVGTMDCPQLDGKRDAQDVVAGYMEVGEFRPKLWKIVRYGERDAGCLLINMHPQAKQAEIVYVAVTAEFRGRGFGLELTRFAQWLAGTMGCEQVILAVDAANAPAIRMYGASGFQQWTEREVWVQSLREFSTCGRNAT